MIPRLYVLSIIFEPLLFFVITDRSFISIPISFSRILQIVVILGMGFIFLYKLSDRKFNISIINIKNPLYFYIFIYFFFLIIVGIINTFSLMLNDDFQDQYNALLNAHASRQLLEYVIELFYIVYFFVLPFYMFRHKAVVDYFFNSFKIVFLLFLVIGFFDILSIYFLDFDPIPRHIRDWTHIGFRFHGIAGEPRQAYAYLLFGVAMLNLKAFYYDEKMSIWWLVFTAIAILYTQSMTAVLGALFFVLLYLKNSLFRRINIIVIFSSILFIALVFYTSDRLVEYAKDLIYVKDVLDRGEELPYLMKVQATSIYPLYDFFVSFRDFEWFSVLFGSGFGSSSIINNIYMAGEPTIRNPNAQISRILYESGVFGLILIMAAFSHPIKTMSYNLTKKSRHVFIIYTLLLLGSFFAIRSPVIYIYTGVFIAVFKLKHKQGSFLNCVGNP